mgnify:CR=1 FL=1
MTLSEFMPRVLWWLVLAPALLLFLPLYPLFWLSCRLRAQVCPKCGSKWRTELVGEWDCEMWDCHACGYQWETR